MTSWHIVHVNPVPWTAPSATSRRGKGGKGTYVQMYASEELKTFKQAVQEQLAGVTPYLDEVELTFYFWRQLPEGLIPDARKRRAHQADATNLQKSLEDALQGHLIENDKNVRSIRSVIVEQTYDCQSLIVIKLDPWRGFSQSLELPESVLQVLAESPEIPFDNDESEVHF